MADQLPLNRPAKDEGDDLLYASAAEDHEAGAARIRRNKFPTLGNQFIKGVFGGRPIDRLTESGCLCHLREDLVLELRHLRHLLSRTNQRTPASTASTPPAVPRAHTGSDAKSPRQPAKPSQETIGHTIRFSLGRFRASKLTTQYHTRVKTLATSSTGRRFTNSARAAHPRPRAMTAWCGLRKRGWTAPSQPGSSRSLPIARPTRAAVSRSPCASVSVSSQAAAR